uniref:4-coumarate--CoA ligase n=1 Tax=Anthurium amnicola TaxID=1678845 RepID=A0A1D1YDS6_9ARAE
MSCCKGHICQCLSRIFRREAAVTVSRGHGTRTGRQLVEGVLGLALGLLWLGIQRGDVVAIAALNSEWYVEWLLAVAFVGGIAAPLNYRWSVEEARSAVELVNPVMLVVDESCRGWVPELQGGSALPSLKYHVLMGEFPCCFSGNGSVTDECGIKMPVEDPAFDHIWAPEDIALICFTSGTTGRPKGVAISHMALIIQSSAKIATVGYSEDDVYLHTAPLCHIGGISSCITVLLVGGCHVFIPRFDAKIATRAIEQHQVTSLITVPAMVADLASFLGKENRWIGGESVKKVLNGGGGLSHDLTGAAMKIFPHAKLISAYGMTETCSSLTFMVLHDPASRVTGIQPQKMNRTISDSTVQLGSVCVGKPPPHVELCVSGNGNKDGPLVGNILTRGPHVMVRYWNGVTEGASVQRLNGWLDSGDIGWLDGNGELWLVGRTKDRLKSGGENVYPEEVYIS